MPPAQRRSPEDAMQRAFVEHLRYVGVPFNASKGGAAVGARVGAIYKARGVQAGWPDLNIVKIGGRGEPGLFVEVKAANGNLSPAQRRWQIILRREGYVCETVKSLDSFKEILARYMSGIGPDFERTAAVARLPAPSPAPSPPRQVSAPVRAARARVQRSSPATGAAGPSGSQVVVLSDSDDDALSDSDAE